MVRFRFKILVRIKEQTAWINCKSIQKLPYLAKSEGQEMLQGPCGKGFKKSISPMYLVDRKYRALIPNRVRYELPSLIQGIVGMAVNGRSCGKQSRLFRGFVFSIVV